MFYYRQKKKHRLLITRVTTTGTLQNYVFMAVVGLLAGILFTFFMFYSELYLGDASVFWCLVLRMPLLVGLTVKLAFTPRGRCCLLLAPLQLFSSSGQVFIGGQLVLLVTGGPLLNLRHNLDVIRESSSCQQRGVAAAAAEIADILFGPFSSFKQAATEIVNGIKLMVEKLQNVLNAFKRTVMAVADAIQDATKWINDKINGCKTTVGTTYQHCMEAFGWMYDECKVSVPAMFVKMCSVTEFASNLCSSVKPGEYLCDLVYFNVDPLVTTINQRISRLWDRAYALMYFKVDIHHEYSMDSNSKSIAEVLRDRLMSALDSTTVVSFCLMVWGMLSLFLQFFFIWKIYRYRSRYLKREDFDNFFITERLKALDMQETLKGHESVFPLKRIERKKFIWMTSPYFTKKEFKNFTYPTTVIFKTVVVLLIMGVDHVLYSITEKCRVFMLAVMQSLGSRPDIDIVGSGFIAGLSRRVIRALNYVDYNFYHTHFMPCMPNPRPPNSWTNKKILFFLFMFWISWIARPFSLRLRHVVMDFYHPDMADRRAKYLYNSIIIKRVTFASLIRIKLKAKFGTGGEQVSIANVLRVRFPCITLFIGKGTLAEACMICEHVSPPLYRCPTIDCLGIYCDDCYLNVKGVCCLCKDFMMHSDFKDVQFDHAATQEASHIDDTDLCCSISDDVDEDLDFSYQGGTAHVDDTLRSSMEAQHNGDLHHGSSERGIENVYYAQLSDTSIIVCNIVGSSTQNFVNIHIDGNS